MYVIYKSKQFEKCKVLLTQNLAGLIEAYKSSRSGMMACSLLDRGSLKIVIMSAIKSSYRCLNVENEIAYNSVRTWTPVDYKGFIHMCGVTTPWQIDQRMLYSTMKLFLEVGKRASGTRKTGKLTVNPLTTQRDAWGYRHVDCQLSLKWLDATMTFISIREYTLFTFSI